MGNNMKIYTNEMDMKSGRYTKTYLTPDGNDYKEDMACFITLANHSGGADKPLFLMNSVDARKFCSSPETSGKNFMAIWRNAGDWDVLKKSHIVKNNGSFDHIIRDLNLTAYEGSELLEMFNSLERVY